MIGGVLPWIAGAESSGNIAARNPWSSASGLFQITDGTFRNYMNRLGLNWSQRNDPMAQTQIAQAIQMDAQNAIGRTLTPGEAYGAHFLGVGGLRAFLGASPTDDAYSVYARVAGTGTATQAFARNPGLLEPGMTVGGVLSALEQRVARYAGFNAPGFIQTSGGGTVGTAPPAGSGASGGGGVSPTAAAGAASGALVSVTNWLTSGLSRTGFIIVGVLIFAAGLFMLARSQTVIALPK